VLFGKQELSSFSEGFHAKRVGSALTTQVRRRPVWSAFQRAAMLCDGRADALEQTTPPAAQVDGHRLDHAAVSVAWCDTYEVPRCVTAAFRLYDNPAARAAGTDDRGAFRFRHFPISSTMKKRAGP